MLPGRRPTGRSQCRSFCGSLILRPSSCASGAPAPVVRPGLSPNLTFVAIALGETRGMLEKLQSACADLTLEEQRILMAGCSMIKRPGGPCRTGRASLAWDSR